MTTKLWSDICDQTHCKLIASKVSEKLSYRQEREWSVEN